MNNASQSAPVVMVCVPTYNAEDSVAATLESLWSQTFDDFEIAVLDNASTDRTLAVVEQTHQKHLNAQPLRVLASKKNIGRIPNWNRCLDVFLASGSRYLKFAFTGDTLEPDGLAELVSGFSRHVQLGLVTAAYDIHTNDGIHTHRVFAEETVLSPKKSAAMFVRRNWVGAPVGNLLSRRGVERVRFSNRLSWAADWKFYLDVATQGDVLCLPNVVGHFQSAHRKHFQKFQRARLQARAETLALRAYALTIWVRSLVS